MGKNGSVSQEKIESLHPATGADMVSTVRLLSGAAPLIRSHQELWDGSGYPQGLKGDTIPLGSRILSFVESLENMRDRIKKEEPRIPEGSLRLKLEQFASENIDILFDPQVVAAYLVETSPSMGAPV